MKTLKEAFETMAEHLMTQGKKCEDPSRLVSTPGRCLYRGPDGMKCAIGILIDDNEYHISLEFQAASDIDVVEALDASGWPTDMDSLEIYDRMQEVHDDFFVFEWPEKIEKIKDEYFND